MITRGALIVFSALVPVSLYGWSRVPVAGGASVAVHVLLVPVLAWLAWPARARLIRTELIGWTLWLLAFLPAVVASSTPVASALVLAELAVYVVLYLSVSALVAIDVARLREMWIACLVSASVVTMVQIVDFFANDRWRLIVDRPSANQLALVILSAAMIAAGWSLVAARYRTVSLALFAVTWVGMVLTLSRSVWLVAVSSVTLLIALTIREASRARVLSTIAVAVFVPVLLLPTPQVRQRVSSSLVSIADMNVTAPVEPISIEQQIQDDPDLANDRSAIWAAGARASLNNRLYVLISYARAVLQRPLLGHGPGHNITFANIGERGGHNSYVTIAYYAGLPAAVLFVVVIAGRIWSFRRSTSLLLTLAISSAGTLVFADHVFGPWFWGLLCLQPLTAARSDVWRATAT